MAALQMNLKDALQKLRQSYEASDKSASCFINHIISVNAGVLKIRSIRNEMEVGLEFKCRRLAGRGQMLLVDMYSRNTVTTEEIHHTNKFNRTLLEVSSHKDFSNEMLCKSVRNALGSFLMRIVSDLLRPHLNNLIMDLRNQFDGFVCKCHLHPVDVDYTEQSSIGRFFYRELAEWNAELENSLVSENDDDVLWNASTRMARRNLKFQCQWVKFLQSRKYFDKIDNGSKLLSGLIFPEVAKLC